MDVALLDHAIELLEKANAELDPELLSAGLAREVLLLYSRIEKLGAFGVATVARKVSDERELARVTGTSVGKAKTVAATGEALAQSHVLNGALRSGRVSLDQASEIAKAEQSAPGSAQDLLQVAETQSFHVLKEKARAVTLEAEQHRGLAQRQREARSARSYSDQLGMTHVHLCLEPHVGTPIVARAEAEAARLFRAAKKAGETEPFERYLADGYAALLSGGSKSKARRPELVVLVSHEVAKRGWKDVRDGEVCKIPGVGPVAPEVAKAIAQDAFLNGVFYDGKDLRHFERWGRHIPIEIRIALELGEPPDFDGWVCVECGNRFRIEIDHVEPYVAGGPSSLPNFDPRCWRCHKPKTEADRKAGKLRPPDP